MTTPPLPSTRRSRRDRIALLGVALAAVAAVVAAWALAGGGAFGPLWIALAFVLVVAVIGARCR